MAAPAFPPVLVTAPAVAPASLTLLKAHARQDGTDSDTALQAYLDAAVAHVDGYGGVLGRCLVAQTWRQDYAAWAPALRLPFPDVSAIVSVAYFDAAGDSQTVDSAEYELVETVRGGEVWFKQAFAWPALDDDRAAPVRVTFTAGYGATAADVPAPIVAAILMLAAGWHASRESVNVGNIVTEMPFAVSALLAPYRRLTP